MADPNGRSEHPIERMLCAAGGVAFEFDWNTGAFTFVSSGAEPLLGFPIEDWYRPGFWAERLHPDDRGWAVEFCTETTRKGEDHRFQHRMIRADGGIVWVDDVVSVDPEKRLEGMLLGLMIDITEAKTTGARLETMQSGFRALLDHGGLLAVEVDSGGRIDYVNAALADLLGVDAGALVGRSADEVVSAFVDAGADSAGPVTDHEAVRLDLDITDSDGRTHSVEWHTVTIGPPDSRASFSIGIDVTERTAWERDLEQNRDLMDEAEHIGGFGHYRLDIARDRWVSSDGLDRILGIDADHPRDAAGWLDIVHPEDRERMDRYLMEHVIGSHQPFDEHYRIVRRSDGDVRTVYGRGTLSVGADGAPVEMVGTIQDVTPQIAALDKLRESEERFRHVVEESPFGMHFYQLLADGTLEFADANPAADRLLGIDHTELVGLRIEDAFPALADSQVIDAYQRVARKGGNWQTEQIEYQDGRIAGAFAVTAFRTAPERIAVAFQDVAETAEAHRKERVYVRRLSDLAADLTAAEERERRRLAEELHDRVTQPLAVSRMRLQQLDADLGGQYSEVGAIRELIETAIAETRALTAELAPQILYELGLPAALRWLGEEFERNHGLRCAVTIEVQRVSVSDDARAALFRAARECLINAVKHAGVSEASVSLDDLPGTVALTVSDRGRGFALGEDASAADLGFGLFSIRERIRSLGGDVEVETAPGQGTCVTITVPRGEV